MLLLPSPGQVMERPYYLRPFMLGWCRNNNLGDIVGEPHLGRIRCPFLIRQPTTFDNTSARKKPDYYPIARPGAKQYNTP